MFIVFIQNFDVLDCEHVHSKQELHDLIEATKKHGGRWVKVKINKKMMEELAETPEQIVYGKQALTAELHTPNNYFFYDRWKPSRNIRIINNKIYEKVEHK